MEKNGESAHFCPAPSTSSLRPVNPVTSHNNNNNNNGRLHACVKLQKISSLLKLVGQNILLLCYYTEQKMYDRRPTCHFHLLLLVFSFFFYCLFVYSTQALCAWVFGGFWWFLVNFKRIESFKMDPFRHKYSRNDAEEDEGEKCLWYVWMLESHREYSWK